MDNDTKELFKVSDCLMASNNNTQLHDEVREKELYFRCVPAGTKFYEGAYKAFQLGNEEFAALRAQMGAIKVVYRVELNAQFKILCKSMNVNDTEHLCKKLETWFQLHPDQLSVLEVGHIKVRFDRLKRAMKFAEGINTSPNSGYVFGNVRIGVLVRPGRKKARKTPTSPEKKSAVLFRTYSEEAA
jgi:hypothetical protein